MNQLKRDYIHYQLQDTINSLGDHERTYQQAASKVSAAISTSTGNIVLEDGKLKQETEYIGFTRDDIKQLDRLKRGNIVYTVLAINEGKRREKILTLKREEAV